MVDYFYYERFELRQFGTWCYGVENLRAECERSWILITSASSFIELCLQQFLDSKYLYIFQVILSHFDWKCFRFGKWRIRDKLDEGGFGHVYLVEDVEKHEFAALKAEPNDVSGGSTIKLEACSRFSLLRKIFSCWNHECCFL